MIIERIGGTRGARERVIATSVRAAGGMHQRAASSTN